MQTKARIAGHPIHPMLIGFPIALYTATVAALLAYLGTTDPFWYRAALIANLAGLVMAGLAVIFGAIDLFALPARSIARETGLKHAGLNVLTNLLFLTTGIFLWRTWSASGQAAIEGSALLATTWPLALGIAGLVVMAAAGALGWKLVQTHHVGVKPFAHAEPAVPAAPVVLEKPAREAVLARPAAREAVVEKPAAREADDDGVIHIPIHHH